MITLKRGSCSAEVYTFGGVVTSFKKNGRDLLYVRPDAKFDKSKPISGAFYMVQFLCLCILLSDDYDYDYDYDDGDKFSTPRGG